MDNKVFDLLEKMYIEMQEMKGNMATKDDIANMATKDDIANMATKDDIVNMATKDDIANMATKDDIIKINHSLVRLEQKMDIHHKALYDGYKQSIEGITDIKEKLEKLTDRVENQEIKLQVLRSVK